MHRPTQPAATQNESHTTRFEPRRKPQQARSIGTIEKLLDAAGRVVEQDGIGVFSTVRVADEAGMATGSVYQYFPDKYAILVALIERWNERFVDALNDGLGRRLGSDRMIDRTTELYRAEPGCLALLQAINFIPELERSQDYYMEKFVEARARAIAGSGAVTAEQLARARTIVAVLTQVQIDACYREAETAVRMTAELKRWMRCLSVLLRVAPSSEGIWAPRPAYVGGVAAEGGPGDASSRGKLLGAAGRVLAREGVARFSTVRVAREAGMAVGSVYRYFGDKYEILRALLRVWNDRFVDIAEQTGFPSLSVEMLGPTSAIYRGEAGWSELVAATSAIPELREQQEQHLQRFFLSRIEQDGPNGLGFDDAYARIRVRYMAFDAVIKEAARHDEEQAGLILRSFAHWLVALDAMRDALEG